MQSLFSSFNRFLLPLTMLGSLALLGIVFLWGFSSAGGGKQTITITEGMSQRAIASDLAHHHLIRSPYQFLVASKLLKATIKAGTYSIDPNKNMLAILRELSGGVVNQVKILIPEGWRKEQIAEALTQQGLDGQGFLRLTKDKEGYLFPDTYLFTKEATAEQVVERLSRNFDERTKNLHPTKDQVILASIVEREAKRDSQRALIAGIYLHRLAKNMPLEADPTVQYAKETNLLQNGKSVPVFWQPITVADYKAVVSAYNAYSNPGYPPGPICNPGLVSLEAAAHPESTDALYFFHTQDGDIVTSKTLDEHHLNIQKYLH